MSARGWSDLLTTRMSAISRMPALIACTSSPAPGTLITIVVWAVSATSTSSCPAPTVSTMIKSLCAASITVTTSFVVAARPPSAPRVAIERMNTPGSEVSSCIRMRSPSTAPRLNGLVGSTATIPRLRPRVRYSRASAPTSVLLPEPAGPVIPTMCACPVWPNRAFIAARPSGKPFSTRLRTRESAACRPRAVGRPGHLSRPAGGAPGGSVLSYPLHDVQRRGPGAEYPLEPQLLQLRYVLVRYDPAAEENHVIHAALLQLLHHTREELQMRPREDREPDGVRVFLKRGLRYHLRRLADAGVHNLHAGVAQGARDNLRPAVVAIEAGLGDYHLDLPFITHSQTNLPVRGLYSTASGRGEIRYRSSCRALALPS